MIIVIVTLSKNNKYWYILEKKKYNAKQKKVEGSII